MKREFIPFACVVGWVLGACQAGDAVLTPYEFRASSRMPQLLQKEQAITAARTGLQGHEVISSTGTFAAYGIGHTVVQVVAEEGDHTRAYVVDEDGTVLPTQEFWGKERKAREARFGKMVPSLFEQQAALESTDTIEAEVLV